jgi:hypothetical protein
LRRRRLQRLPLDDGDEEGEDEMMQEERQEDMEEDEDEDGEGLYDPGRHHNNMLDHAAAMAAVAAGLPLSGAGRGGGGGGAKRPAGPKQPKQPAPALGPRKYVSSQITVPILEQEGCFNMTQVDAARHLGFGSSTVLKKASGRVG